MTAKQWSGHAPDLVRDNRLMHERIAELEREVEQLRRIEHSCPRCGAKLETTILPKGSTP